MTVRPDELASAAADLLGERAYPESQVSYAGVTYWLERADDDVKRLVAVAEDESAFRGFAGTAERIDGGVRFVAETTPENALALRSALPWLTPAPFGLHTSAGFGDRLGLATPGHVRALKAVDAAINPVFAQQSIREMGRCHRTPRDVLDDATWGAFQAGWTKPVGGDADHLEQLEDIDDTAAAGFVFYTLDPKAEVDPEAEHADPAAIRQKVDALDWAGLDSDLATFTKKYVGQRIDLEHEAIELDEESVLRAMAKYGPSLPTRWPCTADLWRRASTARWSSPSTRPTIRPSRPSTSWWSASCSASGWNLSPSPRASSADSRRVWSTSATSTSCSATSRSTPRLPGRSARTSCPCTPAPTSTPPIP